MFVEARWFYAGRTKTIRVIVVHCTVSSEMGTGAEDVARYFANLPSNKKASAHKVADNDSVVTCVNDQDTAFGAAGANADGLHLELVGQPTQTREEWLDAYSTHELAIGLTVVREWSDTHDIPLRWLTIAEVADGISRGVTTHADVSKAFPKVSTGHWDPGPDFPRDVFLSATSPAPRPRRRKMIHLIRSKGTKPVYATDLVTKRWVHDETQLAHVKPVITADGGIGEVQEWDPADVDAIPTIGPAP